MQQNNFQQNNNTNDDYYSDPLEREVNAQAAEGQHNEEQPSADFSATTTAEPMIGPATDVSVSQPSPVPAGAAPVQDQQTVQSTIESPIQPVVSSNDLNRQVEEYQVDDNNADKDLDDSKDYEAYILSTRQLLAQARKDRDDLIAKLDQAEDELTQESANDKTQSGPDYDYYVMGPKMDRIHKIESKLNDKKHLIRSLNEILRSLN